jgi:hypothetical protein
MHSIDDMAKSDAIPANVKLEYGEASKLADKIRNHGQRVNAAAWEVDMALSGVRYARDEKNAVLAIKHLQAALATALRVINAGA